MKNIILIIGLLTTSLIKAQELSLETIAQCMGDLSCPKVTYVKDVNHSLDKFVGTWQGTYNGKIYKLILTKETIVREDLPKWDKLMGTVNIRNNSRDAGITEETHGVNFQPDLKAYLLHFSGPKTGCIDYGTLYLRIIENPTNKITMRFWADVDIVIEEDCPNDFQTTIPTGISIVLTKQP